MLSLIRAGNFTLAMAGENTINAQSSSSQKVSSGLLANEPMVGDVRANVATGFPRIRWPEFATGSTAVLNVILLCKFMMRSERARACLPLSSRGRSSGRCPQFNGLQLEQHTSRPVRRDADDRVALTA